MRPRMTRLRYTNFHDLEQFAQLSAQTRAQLEQAADAVALFARVEMLYRNAKESKDLETAYVYFYRAMHVCNMIVKCKNFAKFSQSPQSKLFARIYDQSMSEFDKTKQQLALLYEELIDEKRNLMTPKPDIMTMKPRPPSIAERIFSEDFGNFIRPKELVEFISDGKNRRTVLIVDYRLQHQPSINYRDPGVIRTLPIDESLVTQGLMFLHLANYSSALAKSRLKEITSFDLVVLMGDELERSDATPFKQDAPTKWIYNALTDANYTAPLKHKPLLLEGGFGAWELAYPMHVESAQPRDLETVLASLGVPDRNPFTTRQAQNFDSIVYPTLEPPPREPLRSMSRDPIDTSTHFPASQNSLRDKPRPSSRDPLPDIDRPAPPDVPQRLPRHPASTVSSPELPTDIKHEHPRSPTPPSVPSPFEQPHRAPPPLPMAAPVHRVSPVAGAPTSRKTRSSHYSTLGGARIDAPCVQPTYASSSQGQRPQVPSRNLQPINTGPVQRIYYQVSTSLEAAALRRPDPMLGHTGLVNRCNTCFMNSALQALFYTPGMRMLFTAQTLSRIYLPKGRKPTEGWVTGAFTALMDTIWTGQFNALDPEPFRKIFAEVDKSLTDDRQHDAEEFFIQLVDTLNEDTNRVMDRIKFNQDYDDTNLLAHAEHYRKNWLQWSSSPINDLFDIRSVSQLTCKVCGKTSVTFDDMNHIILELPAEQTRPCHLHDCLKRHFGDTTLDGEQRWKCPSCRCAQPTRRSTRIWKVPPVVMVCLKRSSMRATLPTQNAELVKNNVYVDFDINNFDLSRYVHEVALGASMQQTSYQLYAITNHTGSPTSGHYTSSVRVPHGGWLRFNDDKVSETSEASLKSSEVFMLYYTNGTSITS